MAITMYQATVPTCVRALSSLASILEKAEAHAAARKIDPAVLLNARLAPDMFPLLRQILIANDTARGGAARLARAEVPAIAASESTFPELIARTRGSVAYLQGFTPEQFVGSEDLTVTWQTRSSSKSMQGLPYLFHHVLPNLYFHVTTAYDILRRAGIELGKADFLGTA